VASQLGCTDVVEVDAATNTGIDAMRQVTDSLRYTPLSQGKRMIILDECHSLSKQAWQSLLKAVEEPPPHSYFCFCTTESEKVPKTIVTRCFSYSLREVPVRVLFEYLASVAEAEELDVDEDLIDLSAAQAAGSVRQALVNLSKVNGASSIKEAEALLESAAGSSEVIDLCRLLVSGKLTWSSAVALVASMQEQNPESIRIVVVNYVGKVLMGAKESNAVNLLSILDEFSQPFNANEKMVPVLLALGRLLWR
jgi:DNA polymerase III subunit gamma/tau